MAIPSSVRTRRNRLVEVIEAARTAYYQHATPELADDEYDRLFAELVAIEAEYPELVTADSPTQTVGGETADLFGEFEHPSRMWSLDNVFDAAELGEWLTKTGEHNYLCELKIDGLAVNIVYRDGVLDTVATRGSGAVGENVTSNVEFMTCIPQTLTKVPSGRAFGHEPAGRTPKRGAIRPRRRRPAARRPRRGPRPCRRRGRPGPG